MRDFFSDLFHMMGSQNTKSRYFYIFVGIVYLLAAIATILLIFGCVFGRLHGSVLVKGLVIAGVVDLVCIGSGVILARQ